MEEEYARAYEGDIVQIEFAHGIETYKVINRYYDGLTDVGIICIDEDGEFVVFDGDYEMVKKVNNIHNIL